MTGAWDSIKLLGAVSDSGETFFLSCAKNFNSDTTIRLLDALQSEFGEEICVVLNNFSSHICDYTREKAAELGIVLVFLPVASPHLQPIEPIWEETLTRFVTHLVEETFLDLTRSLSFAAAWLNRFIDINMLR